jgi:hypothetical protein
MQYPCNFVQSYGHMRSNQRANIVITQDTIDCIRLHLNTPGEPGLDSQVVIAGQNLYALHAALGKIVAKAKKYDRERAAAATDQEKYELGRRYAETAA